MLDEKDQILYEHLLANARFPIKKLAKVIHSSQATVINRIKRLEDKGYISRYDAIINWQKIPLIKKIYHIKTTGTNYNQICSDLKKQNSVFSMVDLSGLYNLQVWCFFKTKIECSSFERLLSKLDYIGMEIEKLEFPKVSFFNKDIKIPLSKTLDRELKLDKIDIAILKYLAIGGGRDSLLEVSYKLKIPYDTVNYRFKRLLKFDYFSRIVAQPGESAFTLQTTALYLKFDKDVNLGEVYKKISKISQVISLAKNAKDSMLIHFNSLDFKQYQDKINEIFSVEKRNKINLVLISHWKKILLNNRYPLEKLLN